MDASASDLRSHGNPTFMLGADLSSLQRSLGRVTQQLVRQAKAYMHTHFPESLSREDIACHVGISADYLTDCFRQEMNITPMTYLRHYRLRQARQLLENTNLTITQVAGQVGFSESAHFTHIFQQENGVTPRAYRNGKRKQVLPI
jgi:transcriptional regulator GlxA family with amidase domain